MYEIKSSYDFFDIKKQKNTFFYYNHIIVKYLKNNCKWFNEISKTELEDTQKEIKDIWSDKSKDYIEPYNNIYNKYLTKYKNIFSKSKTFIDCGCAPGGFLKFASDNEMKGYGITLLQDKNNGGLKLKYEYDVIYGDLLDDDFVMNLDKKIKDKVDFINLGAIFYGEMTNSNEQVKLLLNQFYIVRKFLKKGGNIMFVLDIFYTMYDFIIMMNFFLKRGCKIHFIPVQPSFQTRQVYVLVENVKITNITFQKMTALKYQRYLPIVNIYDKYIEDIFNSLNFDIESFKKVYYICLLNKRDIVIKENMILYKLIPTIKLDISTKSNYNLKYIVYPEIIFNFSNEKIYSDKNMYYVKKIVQKMSNMRDVFIKKNKLNVDENNVLIIQESSINNELLISINSFVKKIMNYFLKKTLIKKKMKK